MTEKVLTPEQQAFCDKVKADIERDKQAEIPHDEVLLWMDRARKVKPETLNDFLKEVHDAIPLSYGNICHKIAIASLAAAYSFENSDQGGITGFQSGAVMWGFVCAWTRDYDPQKFIHYKDMLYPQMDYKFTTISQETFAWLQAEAKKSLADDNSGLGMHPDVVRHQKEIVAGKIPFGYTLED